MTQEAKRVLVKLARILNITEQVKEFINEEQKRQGVYPGVRGGA